MLFLKILILFFPIIVWGYNLELIKQTLAKELTNQYPSIIIKNIDLKSNSLAQNFDEYEFLRIANAKLNRAQGFIRVEFKTPENRVKNVFFRYFIQAKIEVLRSRKNIRRGDSLNEFDYDLISIAFDKLPFNALELKNAHNLIAKTNIKSNTILKENMFNTKALIKKNDPIIGILKEKNIDILVNLTALENGNLGEKIRSKNKNGKIIQGIIIDKNRILIQ